jgi:hypothetical protein
LISLETCTITNRELDSLVSGTFVVAAGASGSYLVTVATTGRGDSASAGFTTGCPVGGVVESVSNLVILSPWLAVIGLVGCIGIVVVVAKKRRASGD